MLSTESTTIETESHPTSANGAPRASPAVTQRFLADVYGDKPEGSFITVATFEPDEFAHAADLAEVFKAANRLIKARRNVYYAMGLQSRKLGPKQKGERGDVSVLMAFWLDVDVLDIAHKAPNLPPTPDAARKILNLFPYPPTFLIWSGHGWQGVWLLKEPWVFESIEERHQAQALLTRFQRLFRLAAQRQWGWLVDPTANLDRVMRLPGSVNWKTPEHPVLVTIEAQTDTRLDPSEIAEALDDLNVPEVQAASYTYEAKGDYPPADAERIGQVP